MRFKKAHRNLSSNSFTFMLVPSNNGSPVWNIDVENWKLYLSIILIIFTGIFSSLINTYSPDLIKTLSSYQVATLEQKEYKQKLMNAIQNGIVLKDHLRDLRARETNLRDLLSLSPRSRLSLVKEQYYEYPIISTQGFIVQNGAQGKVLIDNKPVLEFFDSSATPRAEYRAQVTAERLKDFLASKETVKKIKIVPSAQNVHEFEAEFNGTTLFTITKDDAEQFDTSPYLLAQKWRDDLLIALTLEKKEHLSSKIITSIQDFFRKRKEIQYKKFETFFSEIDYPVQTVSGLWQINDPRIRKVNHLVNFIKRESSLRKNSYASLSDTIFKYRARFDITPSQSPVGYSFVISPYGWRRHPLTRKMAFHTGIDLPCMYGAPVIAAASGKISRQGWMGGYGYTVEIDHGYDIKTLYAHNSAILTRVGQYVRKGQVIAHAGKSGLTSGVHSHYEVRVSNRPVNPVRFLNLDIFTACKDW